MTDNFPVRQKITAKNQFNFEKISDFLHLKILKELMLTKTKS